jgi:hypothetical protein
MVGIVAMTHNFDDSATIGKAGGTLTYRYLLALYGDRVSRHGEAEDGTELQLAGVDFVFYLKVLRPEPSEFFSIQKHEVKTDIKSAITGRCFLEINKNDSGSATNGCIGWALDCGADYIHLFLPHALLLLTFHGDSLAAWTRAWDRKRVYPSYSSDNGTYSSWGLCVPIEAVKLAAQVDGDAYSLAEYPEWAATTAKYPNERAVIRAALIAVRERK